MGRVHRLRDDDEVPLAEGPPALDWRPDERISPDRIIPVCARPETAGQKLRGGIVDTLRMMPVGGGYKDTRSTIDLRNRRSAWRWAANRLGYKIETFKTHEKGVGIYLLIRRIA